VLQTPVGIAAGNPTGHAMTADTRDDRYAAAERLKDAGDLAAAVVALEGLVADHPEYPLAHSALAAWCTRLERHEDAVRHARRVCELEPDDPFSYTALSVACMRAGRIAEAEEALARSRMLQSGGR
jgi:Flp pilus assembly protein TadD